MLGTMDVDAAQTRVRTYHKLSRARMYAESSMSQFTPFGIRRIHISKSLCRGIYSFSSQDLGTLLRESQVRDKRSGSVLAVALSQISTREPCHMIGI